jgi:hypothetical protein
VLQELQAVESLGVLDVEVDGIAIVFGETGDRGSVELGGHVVLDVLGTRRLSGS